MSMLRGCGCLAGIMQMLRSLRQRLLGQDCRCRDSLLANREAAEVCRLEEAARSVSEEELAHILGNSFPSSAPRPGENCEDSEELERLQEEFLEIVQSSDSQAALRAVESATSEIVNASDECVGSALHFIAAEGHVQACRALLARSDFGQVNSRNGIGSTALHIAAANDEEEICKMILACSRFTVGANAVNNNGQTSMDFAAEFGTGLCLDILEASGCRYGTCRRRGRQVLTRRPANALGAQVEEVADMNESASHLPPDFVSPPSSCSGILYSGLLAQRARCGQDYQAMQLGVVTSCALVCRWRHRRKTCRGIGRRAARLPAAGKYDGPALDEYFGSDPFRAFGRLLEVLSRINAARTAWQDSNLSVAVRGQRLRSQVASLGTVFVKLAQTMATRSDLVTKELGKELGLLQDAMGQFSNDVAMQTIREEFDWDGPVAASGSSEGGQLHPGESAPLFSSLTDEPVAAASLAQVYRGILTDGTEVAVKVQRPGLAELVGLDFYVLRRILFTVNVWNLQSFYRAKGISSSPAKDSQAAQRVQLEEEAAKYKLRPELEVPDAARDPSASAEKVGRNKIVEPVGGSPLRGGSPPLKLAESVGTDSLLVIQWPATRAIHMVFSQLSTPALCSGTKLQLRDQLCVSALQLAQERFAYSAPSQDLTGTSLDLNAMD
eukprot:s4698_g11.t2